MVITDGVDYLQRCMPLQDLLGDAGTTGLPGTRRLLRVRGIGRADTDYERRPLARDERWRPLTAALITGLYGYRIPLAFALSGGPEGVRVRVGTWSASATEATQDRRLDVIESVMSGLYAAADLEEAGEDASSWPLGGIALGIPAPAGIDAETGAAALDRVIASLAGSRWSVLVLAYPVSERAVRSVREQVLNEMRAVGAQAAIEGAPSPLGDEYVELLKLSLASVGESLATGAWRTGVYLLGNGESYPLLAAVWRSVFSGEQSLPEPVRVFDFPVASTLARDWTLPDQAGAAEPGALPASLRVPDAADDYPARGVCPSSGAGDARLRGRTGRALRHRPGGRAIRRSAGPGHRGRSHPASRPRHRHRLRDHAVLADQACFRRGSHRLGQDEHYLLVAHRDRRDGYPVPGHRACQDRVPRADDPSGHREPRSRLHRRATPGSPLVLNPLEVPEGIGVGEHIDLRARRVRCRVRHVDAASPDSRAVSARGLRGPGMGPAQRRERAARSRGRQGRSIPHAGGPGCQDPRSASGPGLRRQDHQRSPGLADHPAGVPADRGARRDAGCGAVPFLRRAPGPSHRLELEAIGDEGDKAFLIGLLLVRLVEHRRAAGQAPDLVHLLVIEEAHRLLGNVPAQNSEEAANPRGQAVETFTNLLAEIRAYGQGVIIADQVPVRLAPEVLKNTNLKVAHRTVAADDRAALAGTMAMEEDQARALTTLEVGEAAVFSAGDDAPLLVHVPLVKDVLPDAQPRDEDVTRHMATWQSSELAARLSWPRAFCAETCAGAPSACQAARSIVDDEYVQRTFARVVLSTAEEPGALDRMWDDILGIVRSRRPAGIGERELLRAFAGHAADWYAQRRGSQSAWLYIDTQAVSDRLRAVLLDRLEGDDPDRTAWLRDSFQTAMREVNAREFVPYAACERVCDQDPPLCLYRSAVADLVTGGRYQSSWERADATDARSERPDQKQSWQVCQDAAYELIEFPDPAAPRHLAGQIADSARRVGLCFEQQMLAGDSRKVPRTTRRILDRILDEAQR